MSNRKLPEAFHSQCVDPVYTPLKLIAQGSTGSLGPTGPTQGEGDPKGSYFSTVRGTSGMAGMTGVTGTYVVTTKDPYLAIYTKQAALSIIGEKAGTWTIEFGLAVQNADNTWSIPLTLFNSGAATDLPSGNTIDLLFIFRNSTVLP